MFKRIIIVALIVFGAFTTLSFAKDEERCDAEIGLLQTLKIVDDGSKIELDEYITREKFAVYIAKANNFQGTTKERYFKDLSSGSEAFSYMGELVANGIVAQSYDGIFRAKEYITFDEATKMLVSSLGYGKYADVTGGFPNGYENVADGFDIRIGRGKSYVTYADAFKAIYDTLKCYINGVSGTTISGIKFGQSDKTLCESKFGISFDKGTVIANEYGNIASSDYLGINKALINDTIYDVNELCNSDDMLGCYVTYFYNTDNEEIVYMCLEKQRKKDTIISIDDIDDISGGVVYYESKERLKNIKSETNNIVYNGFFLGSDVANTIKNLNKGYVILRDSDNDSKYDIIMIFDYSNFCVANISNDYLKLYSKLSLNDTLDLSDVKSLTVMKNNEKVQINDIKIDDSLSVLRTKNNDVVRIIINTDNFSGKISSLNDEEVFIDGAKYDIDKAYFSEFNKEARVGSAAEFTIDMFGKIVYIKSAENNWKYGYISKLVDDEYEDEAFIKIITEDGDKKTFYFAKSVKIDEVSFKEYKKIETYLISLDDYLIRYKTNGEDRINAIDTIRLGEKESIEHSLVPVYDELKNWSTMANINKYGNKAIFKESTIGFTVSSGDSDEYGVYKGYPKMLSTGSNSGNYGTMKCYFADTATSDGYCDVYVRTFDPTISNTVTIMMYEKMIKTINDDDELVYEIHGYSSGAKKQVKISEQIDTQSKSELLECKKGDIVKITLCTEDPSKSVVERVYDAHNDKVSHFNGVTVDHTWYSGTTEEGFYTSSANLSYGQIYDRFGNVFSIRNDENSFVNERFKVPETLICVFYDTDNNEIYTGSYQNILTYDDVGNGCMKTIKQCRWGTTTAVYLYQ